MASAATCTKHQYAQFDCEECKVFHCSKHAKFTEDCAECDAEVRESFKVREEEDRKLASKLALEKEIKEKKEAEELYKQFTKVQETGRYIRVIGENIYELVINVNKKIEEGYEPLGSPNINTYIKGQQGSMGGSFTYEGWLFCQFMLKTKKD